MKKEFIKIPDDQMFCVSARNRDTGFTEDVTGPMSKKDAYDWVPSYADRKTHVYFKISMHPFKRHKK